MSIQAKRAFRNLAGATAISALVAGCASGIPGNLAKDTCMNDGVFSPTICKIETQTTIRKTSAKDGPSTVEVTDQQLVVGHSPMKQTGEIIWNVGGTAANVLSGVGALKAGQGVQAYGEGVKGGQLKPGDYINNETTNVNQGQEANPTLTANPAFTANPTLTANPTMTTTQQANPTLTASQQANPSLTATQNPSLTATQNPSLTANAGAGAYAGAGAAATVITPPPAPTPGGPR